MDQLSIYQYRDYRDFLQDFVEGKKRQRGLSYRYFAAKAGFGSPSYLQQVIQGKRHLRRDSAEKVAAAFQLSAGETQYFLHLVELSETTGSIERQKIEAQLDRLAAYARNDLVTDVGFFGNWLHPVIWEMATLKDFRLTIDAAYEHLSRLATKSQIKEALTFLVRRGYLVETDEPDVYRQAGSVFDPINDRECLELQRMHRQFLELAVREVRGDRATRELQNLTIAVPATKIPLIKDRIRRLINELQVELANAKDADVVYHVQIAGFGVTQKQ